MSHGSWQISKFHAHSAHLLLFSLSLFLSPSFAKCFTRQSCISGVCAPHRHTMSWYALISAANRVRLVYYLKLHNSCLSPARSRSSNSWEFCDLNFVFLSECSLRTVSFRWTPKKWEKRNRRQTQDSDANRDTRFIRYTRNILCDAKY